MVTEVVDPEGRLEDRVAEPEPEPLQAMSPPVSKPSSVDVSVTPIQLSVPLAR